MGFPMDQIVLRNFVVSHVVPSLRIFYKIYIPLHPLHQQSVENKGLNTSCPLPLFILHQVENAPFFSGELPGGVE